MYARVVVAIGGCLLRDSVPVGEGFFLFEETTREEEVLDSGPYVSAESMEDDG